MYMALQWKWKIYLLPLFDAVGWTEQWSKWIAWGGGVVGAGWGVVVKRGPSYWKFSEHLLEEDSGYIIAFKDYISTLIGAYEVFDDQMSWELIKIKLEKWPLPTVRIKHVLGKKQLANMHQQLDNISKQISQEPNN